MVQLLKIESQNSIMKFVIYTLMAIGLMTCKSIKPEGNPPFTLQEATYNDWVGGREGVSGIKILINYTSNQEVSFDKIYFQNKEGTLESNEKDGKTFLLGRIDTSTRRKDKDLTLDIDPKKEMNNPLPKTKIPFELKENEAVILYTFKGESHHYKVKNLKKTKTEFYP